MTSFAIGALLGRFLVSYLIVLLVLYVGARIKRSSTSERSVFKRSVSLVGWVSTITLFGIGVSVSTAHATLSQVVM